jgi:hypothetical protein
MKRDDDMLALRHGQAAEGDLSNLGPALEKLTMAVNTRIFTKLLRGETVTPEEALQAWLEKYSYHRLTHELRKTVRKGRRAAETLTELPIG